MDLKELLGMIDHTLLSPIARDEEIEKLCEECIRYGFAAACVNPYNVRKAAEILKGTGIGVSSAVGFPLGATKTGIKVHEAVESVRDGATEIDMVINIGALKDRKLSLVEKEIEEVVRNTGVPVKVILETCYLTDEEKATVCRMAMNAGASFVKTSTGFGPGGATIEDIRLMRKIVGNRIGVKAAGGIRTLSDLIAMVEAGANRIGTSSGAKIAEEAVRKGTGEV